MPYLDLDSWPRRKHFEFFRQYEQPFFSVTVQLDVTGIWVLSHTDDQVSFSVALHHGALTAMNQIDCMRYRIRGDRVLAHETIHGGTTVLLDDDTFTFCYFDFDADFRTFQYTMRASMEAARSGGTGFHAQDGRDDLTHFTTIPWFAFTGAQHPRRANPGDSIPKIAFGKCFEDRGCHRVPVAIDVHHGLVDGVHVGQFIERFESYSRAAEGLV